MLQLVKYFGMIKKFLLTNVLWTSTFYTMFINIKNTSLWFKVKYVLLTWHYMGWFGNGFDGKEKSRCFKRSSKLICFS